LENDRGLLPPVLARAEVREYDDDDYDYDADDEYDDSEIDDGPDTVG